VAAREDQAQAFVGDGTGLLLLAGLESREQLCLVRERALAPDPIDRPVAGRGHQPGTGVGGRAVPGPALQRSGESLLHRVLGQFDVAEDTDEDRERAPPLLPEDGFESHPPPRTQNGRDLLVESRL
jgi:hypothetical protein